MWLESIVTMMIRALFYQACAKVYVLSLCPFNNIQVYILKDFFSEYFSSLNVKHVINYSINCAARGLNLSKWKAK